MGISGEVRAGSGAEQLRAAAPRAAAALPGAVRFDALLWERVGAIRLSDYIRFSIMIVN